MSPFAASDVIEEDGGFGAGFGERTRCATLQRQRMQQQQPQQSNNQLHHHHQLLNRPQQQQQQHQDRFMTLGVNGGSHQNFRAMHNDYDSLSRIKNNLTSLVSAPDLRRISGTFIDEYLFIPEPRGDVRGADPAAETGLHHPAARLPLFGHHAALHLRRRRRGRRPALHVLVLLLRRPVGHLRADREAAAAALPPRRAARHGGPGLGPARVGRRRLPLQLHEHLLRLLDFLCDDDQVRNP